jgi:hypothetical protein
MSRECKSCSDRGDRITLRAAGTKPRAVRRHLEPAATMIDLFADPNNVKAVREEFAKKSEGVQYKAYILPGPPRLPTAP